MLVVGNCLCRVVVVVVLVDCPYIYGCVCMVVTSHSIMILLYILR